MVEYHLASFKLIYEEYESISVATSNRLARSIDARRKTQEVREKLLQLCMSYPPVMGMSRRLDITSTSSRNGSITLTVQSQVHMHFT